MTQGLHSSVKIAIAAALLVATVSGKTAGEGNSKKRRFLKKEKGSKQQRSLPPVYEDGTPVKKKYTYRQMPDGLTIAAKYDGDAIAGTKKRVDKGRRYSESIEWKIRSNSEGFNVETSYQNNNDETDVKKSIFTSTMKMVEFIKDDPENDDEVYIDQAVVAQYSFERWQTAVFEGDCTEETSCSAIFATEDGCLTVITTANLADSIENGRFQLDPDDVKFDYVFGDDCSVSSDANGLAVVGSVRADTKTHVKSHLGPKHAMKDATTEPSMANRQANELDGIESEPDDGVSLFLTWLDEVDCIEDGNANAIEVNINNTALQGPNNNATQNIFASRRAGTPRSRAVNVYTYTPDDLDRQGRKGNKDSNENMKMIHWTVNQKPRDRSCVWDPIIGSKIYDEDPEYEDENVGGSGAFASALASTASSNPFSLFTVLCTSSISIIYAVMS